MNWYQTGLILDYAGTVDPNGCVLTSLTVKPAVTIETALLPDATAGLAYSAPIAVSWGVPPYAVTVSGLPAGMAFDGANVTGVPAAVGSFTVSVTAIDAVGASASKSLPLTVADQPITFFQIEMVRRAAAAGLKLVEVPICFTERRAGKSKMTGSIVSEAILLPWRLRRIR